MTAAAHEVEKPRNARAYAVFLRDSKKRQLAYIRGEQARMNEAARLFELYRVAMAHLELHPLDGIEISSRQSQLAEMEERIDETHGDTDGMRACFDLLEESYADRIKDRRPSHRDAKAES